MKVTIGKDDFLISIKMFEWRRLNMLSRFFGKISINPITNCWEWTAAYRVNGYGLLGTQAGKKPGMILAHRFSYETFIGPIPDGHFICHRCDVRRCVNPAHLFAGTPSHNVNDSRDKGRMRGPAKLTPEKVIEIRNLYASGKYSTCVLAKQYDVTNGCIWGIVRFKNWKWVPKTAADYECIKARICVKLSDEDFEIIKKLYTPKTSKILARRFGVTQTRIIQIGKHGF